MEERIKTMLPLLDEKQRRIFLATEAKSYGRGGITIVSKISGSTRYTIRQGIKEIESGESLETGRIRKRGTGRKTVQEHSPNIESIILQIIDGKTYGDPEKVLSYTTLSLRKIQNLLSANYGINASYRTIGDIIEKLEYSKQANKKRLQVGTPHPDRNDQYGKSWQGSQMFGYGNDGMKPDPAAILPGR